MTERQKKLLEIIVKEYVKYSKPISSKNLVKKLSLSSATIRNEMNELEKKGYLIKPHISGGRIPTEKAYKVYISSLEEVDVPINVCVSDFREMTKILAELSGGFAFGGIRQDFHQSGFSNLLKEAEHDEDFSIETRKIMEEFENHFDELFEDISDNQTRVFIGKESPFKKTKKISLIVSGCNTPEQGLIGLLGPMRMKYDYNISLINKLKQLIEQDYE
ncbi:DeoR family transcriptional regulator [Patescibacteria group bacterium]|nr:DeoR family transcriptional regulator [Patescibacteria group bacterium]MBU3922642.1 DeoR family transcriptional regulator [Patescibacteria group bacterium]